MKFFKKTDLIVIIILLIISATVYLTYNYLAQGEEAKAEIYLGSKLMKTVNLSTGENYSFSIPGKENVVFHLYEDGSIAFEKSDCPDQICVNSGKLHIVGQSAACLPNALILKIVPRNGYNNNQNDVVV
ncbi:MAG: NusG domain II-containing protein [Peptostreptococcaceae bacterium]|nr:NusG domain II-containing protein [Peptostreptococcaceae bacterium]